MIPRQNCAMIVFCCGCRRVPLSSYSEIASIWRATWYSGEAQMTISTSALYCLHDPTSDCAKIAILLRMSMSTTVFPSEVASIWRATWYSGRGANDYINLRVVLSSSLHIDWRQNHCPAADVRRYHCLSVRDSIWRRPTTAEGVANDYCDLSAEFYHHWTSQAFKITFPLFAALIWWGVSLQVILVHLTLFILDAERKYWTRLIWQH
jgi:hypothetical protein